MRFSPPRHALVHGSDPGRSVGSEVHDRVRHQHGPDVRDALEGRQPPRHARPAVTASNRCQSPDDTSRRRCQPERRGGRL